MTVGFVLFLVLSFSVVAKDLGTFGETFPIQEQDLLEVIKSKLKTLEEDGTLQTHQQKIEERITKSLKRPQAVTTIKTTTQPRRFLFNPSFVVPNDLKDHQGKVFQKAGTLINPLHDYSLRRPLLLIDGDDRRQVTWAFKQHEDRQQAKEFVPKIILVKGSPFELMEQFNTPVYFDQGGVLVKKLGIEQVPARVSQYGDRLLIEEVKLKEDQVDD
jgi:conjugal transfer pilus assembly protein TraW